MSQRIILITGANGALGQGIARSFLAESPGNFVWLGVHRQRERADALAAANPNCSRVVLLNVADAGSWKPAVTEIQTIHSRLDVLVNNAGTHDDALLAQMKPESWRNIMSVNLDGVFHGCQAVMPLMIS